LSPRTVQRNIVRGVLTTPKSHTRRRVDVSPMLAEALLAWRRMLQAQYLEAGEQMPPWVFPSLTGTPLEERNVRTVLARLLTRCDAAPDSHP
jgi:integrase